MNGNIFNYSLALEKYGWNGKSAYAIPPEPPGDISIKRDLLLLCHVRLSCL